MSNYEIGYKSLFAGGAGRFNSTVYHMAWDDYQLELVDPSSVVCLDSNGQEDQAAKIPGVCGQPWQRVVANAGKAHITGVNVEMDYAPSENWVLGMNAEWMEAETDTDHDLDGELDANGNLTNELVSGLRLPIVPKFKAAGWVEYHWPVQWEGEKNAFIRTQWSYTGDTYNVLEPLTTNDANPQLKNDAYVIGDIRFGLQGDTWEATFFVNNVTDKRAQYTHRDGWMEWAMASIQDGRPHLGSIYTNRPREIGIHFMKSWGE
jgi:outer membrane receptor protein involved in Fe transport